MAPTNGSAKARRPAANKQAQGPRPVVPAIPLPYVKRQAAAAAAAAAASVPASPAADKHEKRDTNGAPAAETKGDGEASPISGQEASESTSSPTVETNGQIATSMCSVLMLAINFLTF